MDLRHYSDKSFAFDRDRQYNNTTPGPGWKPRGFWVTTPTEDGWLEWCKSELFHIDNLETESAVTLKDDADLMIITTIESFDTFVDQYRAPLYPGAKPFGGKHEGINWPEVIEDYQGIIIAPYFYERRYDHMWYSSFDVASGVIWDLGAVLRVETHMRTVSETERREIAQRDKEHKEFMEKLKKESFYPRTGTLETWAVVD